MSHAKDHKLIQAAHLMGILACQLKDGAPQERIDLDALQFYQDAGITFPSGLLTVLEAHVRWLNEADPILVRQAEQ